MKFIAFTFVLSVVLCGLYLVWARRMRVMDTPNHRSSHTQPTPHGGGVGLMCAFFLGLLFAFVQGIPFPAAYLVVAAAALGLVLLGIADDLRGLGVRLRLGIYAALCLLTASYLALSIPALQGVWLFAGIIVAAFALLALLNFYNFMDGIDGIAASQAVLACAAAAFLAWPGDTPIAQAPPTYALVCALLAAAHLGFLVWNLPPATLFMGDAGSVSTGYLLAALALFGELSGQVGVATWLVLLAVFITDAGWTLLWRLFTGQPFTEPHRLHAYQRLARHWNSHLKVDAVVIAINIFWLFPIAWGIHANPGYALFLVILAYLPLLGFMAKLRRMH